MYPVILALLSGNAEQWPTLVANVHTLALRICERRQAARGDDFANNVALRSIEKLHNNDYKALARFVEHRQQYPDLSFEKWLRGLINNALIDELRSLPNVGRVRSKAGRTLKKREHLGFDDETHAAKTEQTHTEALDVRRIVRWIYNENFPTEQRKILLLWLNGHSIQECSECMNLDLSATRRMLAAARQRLRRQFEERN